MSFNLCFGDFLGSHGSEFTLYSCFSKKAPLLFYMFDICVTFCVFFLRKEFAGKLKFKKYLG